jgi:psiF repeat
MKRSTWVVAVGAAALALVAGEVALADTTPNSQQQKMTSCNADAKAKGLTGDDRKAFMKTCLSNQPAPAAKGNSQQEKMKSCNADAKTKGLTGDDRKAFMKSCLSGSGGAS